MGSLSSCPGLNYTTTFTVRRCSKHPVLRKHTSPSFMSYDVDMINIF